MNTKSNIFKEYIEAFFFSVFAPTLIDAFFFTILDAIMTSIAFLLRQNSSLSRTLEAESIWIASGLMLLAFYIAISIVGIFRYKVWSSSYVRQTTVSSESEASPIV